MVYTIKNVKNIERFAYLFQAGFLKTDQTKRPLILYKPNKLPFHPLQVCEEPSVQQGGLGTCSKPPQPHL